MKHKKKLNKHLKKIIKNYNWHQLGETMYVDMQVE